MVAHSTQLKPIIQEKGMAQNPLQMSANLLSLNTSKTEFMVIGLPQQLPKSTIHNLSSIQTLF
jgi:hypothetical protein